MPYRTYRMYEYGTVPGIVPGTRRLFPNRTGIYGIRVYNARSAVAYIPYIVYVYIGWYLFYKEDVREPNEIRNRIGLLRLHGQEPPTIMDRNQCSSTNNLQT
jgi:hypothetical protein